jgi:hypothetical protein
MEFQLQSQRIRGDYAMSPPPGKTLAIFVDDIAMPANDSYGA